MFLQFQMRRFNYFSLSSVLAPTDVKVNTVTSTTVKITWKNPARTERNLRNRLIVIDLDDKYTAINMLSNSNEYNITRLGSNKRYSIRVYNCFMNKACECFCHADLEERTLRRGKLTLRLT